jgi:hypothetical protein
MPGGGSACHAVIGLAGIGSAKLLATPDLPDGENHYHCDRKDLDDRGRLAAAPP